MREGASPEVYPQISSSGLRRETWLAGVPEAENAMESDHMVWGTGGQPHPTVGCDYCVTQSGSYQIMVRSLTSRQISLG